MLMFGRTRSHSYTINIAGHITVMRNYLKFTQRIWLPWFFNSTVEFADPENPALNRASKTCNNFQKLTEKVLKLLNYLGGNCTNNCLGNHCRAGQKFLGRSCEVWGGSFPPPKRCLDKTLVDGDGGQSHTCSSNHGDTAVHG